MKTILAKVAVGAAVSLLAGGMALGENADEVTVTGSRVLETKVGINYSGIPIKDVSLSYGVSLADVDLASPAGAAEADKRINDAAKTACKEVGRVYPISHPDDAGCIKAAVDKAMAQVHNLVAAAKKPKSG